MLIYLFFIIIIFTLVIMKKKIETLLFLSIIAVKLFIPFIYISKNVALGTYSLIFLFIIIYYLFIEQDSILYKIESLIVSSITFLAIFIGEILLPNNFKILIIDKYIFYGLIISFIIFFLNKNNKSGYIGSIWGILLYEFSSSYFQLKKLKSKVILGTDDIFSIIISLTVFVVVISFIQNSKSKDSHKTSNKSIDEDEMDLLKLFFKNKNIE